MGASLATWGWSVSRLIGSVGVDRRYDVFFVMTGEGQDKGPAVAVKAGDLMKPIHRHLCSKGVDSAWTALLAVVIVVATAMAAFAVAPPARSQQSSAAPQQQKSRAEASPYERWLTEEVVYIITAKERADYLKLTTDEARENFIEQFWERRNPNPGSKENEFKEEYYRRIAYANEHFASSIRPGWKTDRGRIYILYGPADEVESQPAGTPPFEEWRYRYIDGLGTKVVFKFVDRKGAGEYQLVPGSPEKKKLPSP